MLVLLKKEVSNFLSSLIGFIVIIVFLIINGLFLWFIPMDFNILDYGYAGLDGLFIIAPFVFLFLIPAITMRTFAEEKRNGTIEILLTKPFSEIQIVLAKFFASIVLIIFSLLPTLIYLFSVYQLGLPKGNIDMGGTWGSYIGLLLLGAAFAAIGVFCSSITDNQIVSFVISIFICAFFYIGFESIYSLALFGKFDLFIKSLGISHHYASISRGVIDIRDLIYYFSLITLFILLTRISLQSRKW